MGKQHAQQQASQMLAQVLSGLNPPEPYKARFTEASDEFISAMHSPWTAREIVQTWSELYASQFTDSELDQLLAYYTSPLAQKEVAASRRALVQFTQQYQEKYKPIAEAATAKYIQRLRSIVSDCKCAR